MRLLYVLRRLLGLDEHEEAIQRARLTELRTKR